nr:reverse transcriptase domain-containing protein [Tanacetum cinerariifolium]
MIQQVQNSCQFHGLPGDDANRHIDKYFEVTQHMKQNGVFDDALRLSLFPYSLTHHATAWYDHLFRNSIQSFDDIMRKFLSKYFPPSMVTKLRNEIMNFRKDPNESLFEEWERYKLSFDRCPNHNMLIVTQFDTFYNGLTLRHRDTINVVAGGTFMKKRPEECYDLIKNMTAHHNHWDISATRDEASTTISTTNTESPKVVRRLEMMNKNFQDIMKQIQSVKSINLKCKTCGGPHSYTECPAISGYIQEAAYATTGNHNSGGDYYQPQGSGSLPSNTINNQRGDLKAITTRSGVAYEGPSIPPTFCSLPKEVEHEPKVTKDKKLSLPELTPTRMTLKLVNRLVAYPVGVAEDVFVKVEKFYFPVDFVVVDYDVDPWVPLILGRPFLRTARALIDVYKIETFLRTPNELSNLDNDYYDTEGDILYLEKLLNEDPSPNLPLMKNEDLKQVDVIMMKPSIEEPPKLKLKDLPSYLEYAFLEGTDKLPVIISKELKDKEKAALLKVLKSYKRAIAWKISDIKA